MEIADKTFFLRSKLTSTHGANVEYCLFERLLNVRFLRESGRNETFYDKELNMHFINPSALAQIYEIETVDCSVKASSRLSKAAEYIRRASYRYDWLQVKANQKGRVLAIPNEEELKERWQRLKTAVYKDYKGTVVEFDISEIDDKFNQPLGIAACLSQYFYFGLLFPRVPQKHNENWTHSREIAFSEYENEKFVENTTYIQTENRVRHYELTGKAQPDSLISINSYKGYVRVPESDIFPESAEIKIEFTKREIINQWSFELLRYNKE